MKRSSKSDRIHVVVKKVAQKYQIPRRLVFELNRVPSPVSEVPVYMEEMSDNEGKLQGFRISIFNEKISKNELEAILQHELAHARLQSMGFLRVTGSLPIKLKGSKADLDAINRIVGFPWEYYSTLLHAKYFPKSCRQAAAQAIDGFRVQSPDGWIEFGGLSQLVIRRAVTKAMGWKDLEERLSRLISDHTSDSNTQKIDTLAGALERMPELPQDLFDASQLKKILKIMVDTLNDLFNEILEKPLEVPAGLPLRLAYIA